MTKIVNMVFIMILIILFTNSFNQYEYLNNNKEWKNKLEKKLEEREKNYKLPVLIKKKNGDLVKARPVPKDMLKKKQKMNERKEPEKVEREPVKQSYDDDEPSWTDILDIASKKLGLN